MLNEHNHDTYIFYINNYIKALKMHKKLIIIIGMIINQTTNSI